MNYDTKVVEIGVVGVTVTTATRLVRYVKSRRVAPLLSLCALAIFLTACGNKGVIQTTDESAEYKSATSLPPLKKPSELAVEESSTSVLASSSSASTEVDQSVSDAQQLATNLPETVNQESFIGNQAETQTPSSAPLNANIVNAGDSKSQLEINGGFDNAWQYLASILRRSEVTVFSRNKAAGRFAIGCSGVAEDRVVVEKKGSWSVFKRDKDEEQEYCSLKLTEKRGTTLVSVHDRNGIEVANQNSANLFARILNN